MAKAAMIKPGNREKEQRELRKWEKEKARPKRRFYIWYLLLIITIAYMVDEITTQMAFQMQSEIAIGLFNDRMSIMGLASILTLPIMILNIFYKALSDKYGRKIFMAVNTAGMGVGLFLVFFAGKMGGIGGIAMYLAATALINFMIPNDTQVIYLMETAEENKRGTYYALTKFFATLSVMTIPVMRNIFMGSDITRWYYVYLVPALIGIAAAVMCWFCLRETDVFLDSRIAWLKMTDREREAFINQKDKMAAAQGGVGKAFAFAFSHKQLRWLFIIVGIWGLGSIGVAYYSRIMANYFSTQEVTSALLMYPVICAVMYLFNGTLGDKLGRKKVVLGMSVAALVSYALFFTGCNLRWSPSIVGLLVGAYTGSFYSAGDNLITLMTGESAPTNMRASVMSAQGVVNMISKMLSALIPTIVLLVTADNYSVLGWVCLFGSVPFMFFSILLLMLKVGDTSHVNLDTVQGDEWD